MVNDNEQYFKGRIILAIGQDTRSIISPQVQNNNLRDLEEYEFNDCDPEEIKDLEIGIYELLIEYNAWEEGYPESNATDGDSELKILSVKKIKF